MERRVYFVGASLCAGDGNHARGRDLSWKRDEACRGRREGSSGNAKRVCVSERKISFKNRMSREKNSSGDCPICGFPFDLDSLGVYGCPNCHGEGLED